MYYCNECLTEISDFDMEFDIISDVNICPFCKSTDTDYFENEEQDNETR